MVPYEYWSDGKVTDWTLVPPYWKLVFEKLYEQVTGAQLPNTAHPGCSTSSLQSTTDSGANDNLPNVPAPEEDVSSSMEKNAEEIEE
jgi:hypothetical protein